MFETNFTIDDFHYKIMRMFMTCNRIELFNEFNLDCPVHLQETYLLRDQIGLAWIDHVAHESLLRPNGD